MATIWTDFEIPISFLPTFSTFASASQAIVHRVSCGLSFTSYSIEQTRSQILRRNDLVMVKFVREYSVMERDLDKGLYKSKCLFLITYRIKLGQFEASCLRLLDPPP